MQQAKIDALLAEFKRRGADLDAILSRLLGSDDAGVRYTAASQLVGSNSPARLTLETLANPGKPRLAKAAERALRRWRRGENRASPARVSENTAR